MRKEIGNRIKKIREGKNISPKKVADEIEIRNTSLAKIEREGTNSVDTLFKIAKALNVKVTDFFSDKPIHLLTEKNINYGYASQTDLENLAEMVKQLAGQMEKLTELVSKKKKVKPASTVGKKVKSKK